MERIGIGRQGLLGLLSPEPFVIVPESHRVLTSLPPLANICSISLERNAPLKKHLTCLRCAVSTKTSRDSCFIDP